MTPIKHHLMLDGQNKGPYTIGQLQNMWNSGAVTSETQHWMDGYTEWLPLDFIREDLEASKPLSAYASAPPQPVTVRKSRGLYIILGLFLGGLFGIHNFYAGRYSPAVLQLIITLVIGWLIIPIFVVAVWVICECITVTKDGNGVPMS